MDKMNQFADHLLGYLNGAEIFIKTQMPDVVQQFIAYETWKATWQFESSLAFLVCLIALQVVWVLLAKNKTFEGEWALFAIILTGVIGTIMVCVASDRYLDLKKLEIAPKVYMVEQAKKMLVVPK